MTFVIIIRMHLAKDAFSKIVVYSDFLSGLDTLAVALDNDMLDECYLRMDGIVSKKD